MFESSQFHVSRATFKICSPRKGHGTIRDCFVFCCGNLVSSPMSCPKWTIDDRSIVGVWTPSQSRFATVVGRIPAPLTKPGLMIPLEIPTNTGFHHGFLGGAEFRPPAVRLDRNGSFNGLAAHWSGRAGTPSQPPRMELRMRSRIGRADPCARGSKQTKQTIKQANIQKKNSKPSKHATCHE